MTSSMLYQVSLLSLRTSGRSIYRRSSTVASKFQTYISLLNFSEITDDCPTHSKVALHTVLLLSPSKDNLSKTSLMTSRTQPRIRIRVNPENVFAESDMASEVVLTSSNRFEKKIGNL